MKSEMKDFLKESKKEYNNFVKTNRRYPTANEWNEMAKEKELLSNISMKFMGNIKFKK